MISDTMSRPDCSIHTPGACPPLCRYDRNASNTTTPILEILHEWQEKFLDLEWMVDSSGPPDIFDRVKGYDPWEMKGEVSYPLFCNDEC